MKNNSTRLVSVLSAIPKYYRLFEKQLDKFNMLETMDHVLRQTGSMALGEFIFKGKVVDGKLCLPCAPFNVRSVTEQRPYGWYEALYEPVYSTATNASVLVNYNLPTITNERINPEYVANQDEAVLLTYADTFIDHPIGTFVNYVWEDRNDILRFNSQYEGLDVDVIYTTMIADKEGFPYVKDAVIDAICYYNHYLEIQKDFFTKRADVNMLQLSKTSYEQMVAQARSPEFVSDNDWDRLLGSMISINRKVHGKPWRGK
jgi:hypothetical protein